MKRTANDPQRPNPAVYVAAERARAAAMQANLRTGAVWLTQAGIVAIGAIKVICAALLMALAARKAGIEGQQAVWVGFVIALAFVPAWPSMFGKNVFRELANKAFDDEVTRQIEALAQSSEPTTDEARTFARESR